MASSSCRGDVSNPVLWLATQAGKIELSCLLGTTRHVPQEKFAQKVINPPLAKSVWSRWLILASFFFKVMDLNSVSVHKKNTKK